MTKSLVPLVLLSAIAMGCNSTSPATAKKNFSWQQQNDTPDKISCVRSDSSTPVTITADKLDMSVNDGKGCFGRDGKFCNLNIYQIMVESFVHGKNGAKGVDISWGPSDHQGNLKGIIDNLSHIKASGVNAIWLTPIFTTTGVDGQDESFDKLDGTGYYTSDYFSVDPRFGTKEELKQLVNKAHSMGIYVFLDGVFGHAKTNVVATSPNGNKLVLNRMCRDISGYDDKMSLKLGTCFKVDESMDFLKEVATYWIKEVKIDGWRLDQAYQLTGSQWNQITKAVEDESAKKSNTYTFNGKKVQPLGFTFAEIWIEDPKVIEKDVFADKGVHGAFNFPLRYQLVEVLATREDPFARNACSLPAKSINDEIFIKMKGYSDDAIMNNFITNHDTVRFGDLLQRSKYEVDGVKTDSYYQAHLAAISFLAATSGPLTIYYGDETADDLSGFSFKPDNCARLNQCDDHVSRTNGHVTNLTPEEKNLQRNVAKVLKLREKHKALTNGKRVHLFSDHTLYIDLKQYNGDNVLFVLNSGSSARDITITADVWGKLGLNSCTMKSLAGGSVNNNVITSPALSGTFIGLRCK